MDEYVRVRWTDGIMKCFLETCIEEVNRVGRNGGSLRKESWVNLGQKLDEVCNIKLGQKQLKNQYDYLKGKYSGWVYLKKKTGNLYNSVTNTFKLTNEEWEEFFKGHPKAKSLRASPLVFPELCTALFEGTSATGSRVYAPSSTRERTVVSSSSFASHTHTLENEEDGDEVEGQSVDKSSAPSARPKKKSKTKVDMDEVAIEMRDAIQTLVAKQTPSIDVCLERLNTLGLDPMSPFYGAAVDIFGHTKLLRETWMGIPSDPPLLIQWISRTARRLGFME